MSGADLLLRIRSLSKRYGNFMGSDEPMSRWQDILTTLCKCVSSNLERWLIEFSISVC